MAPHAIALPHIASLATALATTVASASGVPTISCTAFSTDAATSRLPASLAAKVRMAWVEPASSYAHPAFPITIRSSLSPSSCSFTQASSQS